MAKMKVRKFMSQHPVYAWKDLSCIQQSVDDFMIYIILRNCYWAWVSAINAGYKNSNILSYAY